MYKFQLLYRVQLFPHSFPIQLVMYKVKILILFNLNLMVLYLFVHVNLMELYLFVRPLFNLQPLRGGFEPCTCEFCSICIILCVQYMIFVQPNEVRHEISEKESTNPPKLAVNTIPKISLP